MSRKHPLKKFQATFIMAFLAVFLGGIVWYEYNSSKKQETKEKQAAMILGWEGKNDYLSARLEQKQEVIEVLRENNIWRIISPVEDLGDDFSIEAWFEDIVTEKGQRIDAKKGADGNPLWSEYGLDNNLKTLTVKRVDGTEAVLQFAEHSAYDGSYYIKYNNDIWVGERSWASVLNKEPKHLRERDIYRHKEDPVGMSFDYPGGAKRDFSIKKNKSHQWVFQGKLKDLPVSEKDVKSWLSDLKKISVINFFDRIDDKKAKRVYRQNQPLVKMSLLLANGKEELWTVSKNKQKGEGESYYIRLNSSSTIFEADKSFIEKLMKSKDYFKGDHPEIKQKSNESE